MQTLAFTKNNEIEVVYLPLELSEVTKTIGNFDNEKLVNSKYYGTTVNCTYYGFLVTT